MTRICQKDSGQVLSQICLVFKSDVRMHNEFEAELIGVLVWGKLNMKMLERVRGLSKRKSYLSDHMVKIAGQPGPDPSYTPDRRFS